MIWWACVLVIVACSSPSAPAAEKAPADQLEGQKMGLEMYAKSWADAKKANPGDGAALVPGCKAAIEMGKVSHPTCFEG